MWLEKNIDKLLARDAEAIAYAIERSCINKVRCAQKGATGRAVHGLELVSSHGTRSMPGLVDWQMFRQEQAQPSSKRIPNQWIGGGPMAKLCL